MKRLKFERIEKGNRLVLTFKRRERVWTNDFRKALFIALSLHFAAFLLFRVNLGVFPTNQPTGATIEVSALIQNASVTALSEAKNEIRLPLLLTFSRAERPPAPNIFLPFQNTLRQPTEDSALFDAYDLPDPLAPGLLFTGQIHLARGYTLKTAPSKKLSHTCPCKGIIAFRALSSTGALIWIDWKKSTGSRSLDLDIEKYLKDVRLKVPSSLLIATGELEVEFNHYD